MNMNAQDHWRKRMILFFSSQCITLLGSQIVQMAIVWYVTLKTDSGAWVAAFSVCAYLPQFFVSFPGGVLADRYHRKYLIIGADLLIALVTLIMMLMMPCIEDETSLLAALLVMSVIRAGGAGIQTPAVNAVIPQLAAKEHLMRCNGVNAAMQSAVQFAAPAAAAVLLTAFSLRAALVVDVLTAMLGIGLFACIKLPEQEEKEKHISVRSDMALGVRYAYGCMRIRKTLAVYGLFLFLTVPAGYLSGLLVSRVYGDTYWYLTAVELAGFGGMAAGGMIMSLWGGFSSRRKTLAFGLALFGMMAAAMGISRNFVLYLGCMAVYGVALTVVQTTITTILQESTESFMQGRIFGLMSALYASCYPLGMAMFGPLADSVPLQGIMVLSGIALAGVAGAVFCDRQLDATRDEKRKTAG